MKTSHVASSKNTWAIISLALILALNIFWIWSHFETHFTFYGGEATRDFLIAKNIAEYGDIPLVGPDSGASKNLIKNSPAYFYLLAFFVYIFKSFTALCIISVIFFLLTLTILFVLAYRMLGLPQALITALVMSVNPFFLLRSEFIWQPDIMLPFFNVSLLFLFLGYNQKKHLYIQLSAVALACAGVIHNSAFAYTPLFIGFCLYSMSSQKAPFKNYVTLIATFLLTLLLLYSPTLYYLNSKDTSTNNVVSKTQISEIVRFDTLNFINKFQREFLSLYYSMSGSVIEKSPLYPLYKRFFTWFIAISLIAYFLERKSRHKKLIICGFCIILWYLFLISLLEKGGGFQYFAPALGITALIYGEILVAFFKTRFFLKLSLSVLFFHTSYIYSYGFRIITLSQLNEGRDTFNIALRQNHPAPNLTISSSTETTRVLARYIKKLKKEKEFPDYTFFEIQAYIANPQNSINVRRYRNMETVTLSKLEDELSEKLVYFNNKNNGPVQLTQDLGVKYIFLVCYEATPEICIKSYTTDSNTPTHISILYKNDLTSVIEILR
jgi:hypothetical protein